MHLQFLIAVQEAIEFSLMAFGGFTLFVLVGFGLVKFWLYCLRLDSDQPSAVSSQPNEYQMWTPIYGQLPPDGCEFRPIASTAEWEWETWPSGKAYRESYDGKFEFRILSSNEEPSTKNQEPFSPGQWVRATRDIQWLGLFVEKGQLIQIELAHRTKTDSEPNALRYSGTCYPHAIQRRTDGCVYPGPSNFFVYPIPPEAIEALPGVPANGCDASRVREDATTGSGQAASG